ncbi:MAG: hypothetical protein ACREGB_05620, partial [Candidatus Saccharimonadales bacterium]
PSNSSEEFPAVPNDPSEIYESLKDRDQARKRAIDIARQRADEAEIEADRAYYVNLAGVMSDIRFELQEFFPEVFNDET